MEKLKVFIYNMEGTLIKEYFYNDFIYAFNEILNHNIENEEEQLNLISDFVFPPIGLLWHKESKNWIKSDKKYLNKNTDMLRFFK